MCNPREKTPRPEEQRSEGSSGRNQPGVRTSSEGRATGDRRASTRGVRLEPGGAGPDIKPLGT